MESQGNDPNKSLSHDELRQERFAEIRDKIDRGLKQLDEGHAINAQEAQARLRRSRAK